MRLITSSVTYHKASWTLMVPQDPSANQNKLRIGTLEDFTSHWGSLLSGDFLVYKFFRKIKIPWLQNWWAVFQIAGVLAKLFCLGFLTDVQFCTAIDAKSLFWALYDYFSSNTTSDHRGKTGVPAELHRVFATQLRFARVPKASLETQVHKRNWSSISSCSTDRSAVALAFFDKWPHLLQHKQNQGSFYAATGSQTSDMELMAAAAMEA